jgi:hypothetical protein
VGIQRIDKDKKQKMKLQIEENLQKEALEQENLQEIYDSATLLTLEGNSI